MKNLNTVELSPNYEKLAFEKIALQGPVHSATIVIPIGLLMPNHNAESEENICRQIPYFRPPHTSAIFVVYSVI